MQNIIQGSSKTLVVRLQQVVNGVITDPVDLTGITEISTCFKNATGADLALTKTGGAIAILGAAVLGKLSITITAAQSALLALVDTATLELSLTYGGDPMKIQISEAYSVIASQC